MIESIFCMSTSDFIFVVGEAMFAHPLGVGAGARALKQAWDAINTAVPH